MISNRLKKIPYHKNIGRVLQRLRLRRGWTLQMMSYLSGYTVPALREIEGGVVTVNDYKLKEFGKLFNMHHEAIRSMADTTKDLT